MNFTIPACLAHLKLDERGYPIPYFVPINNGKPDFKYIDHKKLELAIDKHLCHVCGRKLHKDYHYFVSGPIGMINQVSSDAAMHRECAEFSLQACPHLVMQKAERKIREATHPLAKEMENKPPCMYLIKSGSYKAKFNPAFGYRLIHYKKISAEKYVYVNGRLQKEGIPES